MTTQVHDDLVAAKRPIEATWANREIGRDGNRLKEGYELSACPSCGALNVFVTFSVPVIRDARKHVECRICKMRGPERTSVKDAATYWNNLPRRAIAAESAQETGVKP